MRELIVAKGAALRGRYDKKNKRTQQHFEVRKDELSNAITTVQKDSYILLCISSENDK